MIEIKNFPDYYFCPKKCEIFRDNKIVQPVKKYKREKTYILYQNGIPHIVKFREILKDNLREIEVSISQNLEKFL